MSTLVDYLGRPIPVRDLDEEQARPDGGARSHRLADLDSLTPAQLRSLIRSADDGQYHDLVSYLNTVVRNDGHIGAQIRTRKLALASRPWRVEAASERSEDVRLADAVRELVASPAWYHLILGVQDAVVGPFSAVEILWDTSEGDWQPKGYESRDLRWLELDPVSDVPRLRTGGGLEDLRPWSWIVHRSHAFPGSLARDGLARCLSILRLIKSLGMRAWTEFAEIYGVPMRSIRYPKSANEQQKASYRRVLQAMGLDGYALIPNDAEIEIHEAPSLGAGDFHERFVEWVNREASKAIVGQTMTSDDGSSRAQAEVHDSVRLDILAADAIVDAASINRDLINPFLQLNYGPAAKGRARVVCVTEEPEDLRALIDALVELIDRGFRVSEAEVRDRLGLAEPDDDEPVLIPLARGAGGRRLAVPADEVEEDPPEPEPEAPPEEDEEDGDVDEDELETNADRGQPDLHAEDEPDELDRIAEGADLKAVSDEWVDPVVAAAETAESFEAFRQALRTITITPSKTVEQLAARMFMARGLGDATDDT